MTATHHTLETFYCGKVVVCIGQVPDEVRRQFEKLVRKGVAVKWRGKWYPVAGASFGLGPDKTCYGLASVYASQEAA